jgi:hypothetical protein
MQTAFFGLPECNLNHGVWNETGAKAPVDCRVALR